MEIDEQRRSKQEQNAAQRLRDPNRSPHQAVGTQTLYKKSPQAVPCHITQRDLAVVAAAWEHPEQQDRHADKAPDRFVQKSGMHRQ